MLVDLLATAHAVRVLAALDRLGGQARFTPLRDAAGIGDTQLSRALAFLNGNGYVGGRVLKENGRYPMEYFVSVHGDEALQVVRALRGGLHGLSTPLAHQADEELASLVGE